MCLRSKENTSAVPEVLLMSLAVASLSRLKDLHILTTPLFTLASEFLIGLKFLLKASEALTPKIPLGSTTNPPSLSAFKITSYPYKISKSSELQIQFDWEAALRHSCQDSQHLSTGTCHDCLRSLLSHSSVQNSQFMGRNLMLYAVFRPFRKQGGHVFWDACVA